VYIVGYRNLGPNQSFGRLFEHSLLISTYEPSKKRSRGSMSGSREKSGLAKRIEQLWPASSTSKEEEHASRRGNGKRVPRRLTDAEIAHNNIR